MKTRREKEELTLDPRFYRPPRIGLDAELEAEIAADDIEVTQLADQGRTFIKSHPSGDTTITVKPARTDPPLDPPLRPVLDTPEKTYAYYGESADFEPQGPSVWAPLAAVRAFAKAIKARL